MNYDDLIRKYADRYGIKPEIAQRMFAQESNFDPNAVSNKGAQGLGQLMPDTAKSLGVTNINDPEQNIEASLRYLKQQLDRNNGDYNLALASYNAGPGAVAKYGGIPPFKETQDYVNRINPPTSIDWGSVAEPPKIDWDAAAAALAEERRPELGEGAEHIGPRADNPVVNWFEDLKGDVRAGTGITAPGRLLQKMGSSGAGYTPESNIVAGPFVGPPEVGHGVSKLIDPDSSGMERVRGANEGVAGVAKTVAPVLGVTNPAFLPTVVGYGAVGEAAHKGAELFTDDLDKQELASNLAMIASPGGKRLMGPAGDFVSRTAPITGKVAGVGTGLVKSLRTGNPAWLLSGMPPVTGAISKAADLTGKGMRGFSDLHPFEDSTPAVSSFAEKNNDASRIVDSGPIAKFTGTGTFRGKMGMDQFAPPERLNPKLTAGPIITPPPEPIVDSGPMARPAASQLVRGPGGKMVKQFLTSTAEKGAKAKPAVPLPPNPLSIPQESAPLIETPKPMPEQTVSAGGTGALSSEEVNRGNHVLIDEQGNVKQHLGKQPDLSSKTPEAGKGAIVELNPDNSPKRVVSGRSDIDTSKIQEALKQTSQPAETQLGPQETQSAVDEAIKSMKPPPDEEAGGLAVKPEGPEIPPLVDASNLELDSMDQPKPWEEVPPWENPAEHGDGRGYGDEEGTNDLIQGFEDRSISDDVNLEKWWANQEPKIEGEVPPGDKFPKSNMEDIFNVAQAWVKSRPGSTREEFVSRFTPRGREAAGQAFDAAKGAEHMEQNPSSLIDDSSLKIPSSEELYPTGENWDAQNRKFNEILDQTKKNPQASNAKAWLADQKDLLEIANQKGNKVEADKIQKGIDDFLGGNERLIQTEPLTRSNKSDKIKNMANPEETPKFPIDEEANKVADEVQKRKQQFPWENATEEDKISAQADVVPDFLMTLIEAGKLTPEQADEIMGLGTAEATVQAAKDLGWNPDDPAYADRLRQAHDAFYNDAVSEEDMPHYQATLDKLVKEEKGTKELENLIEPPKPEEENKNSKGTGVSKSSKKDWFDDIPEAVRERKLPDEMTKILDKDTDFFHGSGHDATKTGLKPNMSGGIQDAFDDGEIEMPKGSKPEDFKGIHLATTPERAFFYGPRIHKVTLPAGTKVTVDPLDTDSIIHHSEIKPEDIKTTDLNSHPMNFNGKPIEHVGDRFKLHLTSEDAKELGFLSEEIHMVTESSEGKNSIFAKAKEGELSFTKKQLEQFADKWNEWLASDNRDHDAVDFSSNFVETLVRLAHREGFEVSGHFFSEDRFVKNDPMIKKSGRSRDDILEDQDITNRMRQDLESQGHTAEKVRIARVKPDVGKKTGKTYAETLQERGIETGDDKPLIDEPRAPIPTSKATTKKQALAEVNKLFDDDVINAEEYQNRLREIEHRFRTNQ